MHSVPCFPAAEVSPEGGASCGILRIAVADIISCRGSSADNREFGVFGPDREYVAGSLSYHCRRIAVHWIVHADCRMKGCVKLFQFSHLGQSFVIVPPTICMGDSYRRDSAEQRAVLKDVRTSS